MTLLKMELLQHTSKLQFLYTPVNDKCVIRLRPCSGASMVRQKNHGGVICLSNLRPLDHCQSKAIRPPRMGTSTRGVRVNVSKVEELLKLGDGDDDDDDEGEEESSGREGKAGSEDSFVMDAEERRDWRRKIREVMSRVPDDEDVDEETDLLEKRKKMQKLLADYPLVVEEEDPDWPEDADGWGFNMGQFFNKISIKNVKKDDDENYDSENEIVWQDDDYIRPIKDLTTAEWEEAIFKDFSPLVVLVHNRYKRHPNNPSQTNYYFNNLDQRPFCFPVWVDFKYIGLHNILSIFYVYIKYFEYFRPKENEKVRDELEKAVNIIWNCRLPSPRCVAIDANCELDLVSALQVSVFPELIFTKAGKILYREKAIRTADELSRIMAFFYFGAAKPPCLSGIKNIEEAIPTV
ncbi:hypothetical protein ACS0TY_026181 [Phlomoides rotata]